VFEGLGGANQAGTKGFLGGKIIQPIYTSNPERGVDRGGKRKRKNRLHLSIPPKKAGIIKRRGGEKEGHNKRVAKKCHLHTLGSGDHHFNTDGRLHLLTKQEKGKKSRSNKKNLRTEERGGKK